MNFKESLIAIFDTQQLFDFTPPAFYIGSGLLWWYFLAGSLLSVAILVIYSRIRVKKVALPRQRLILLMARYYSSTYFIGLFSLWSRREIIAFFSMPFWILLLLCIQIGMMLYFFYALVREFPDHQAKYLANIERQRYLPKPHKK